MEVLTNAWMKMLYNYFGDRLELNQELFKIVCQYYLGIYNSCPAIEDKLSVDNLDDSGQFFLFSRFINLSPEVAKDIAIRSCREIEACGTTNELSESCIFPVISQV